MNAKKPADGNRRSDEATTRPVELTDDELETVWGGAPHVRVIDAGGTRG